MVADVPQCGRTFISMGSFGILLLCEAVLLAVVCVYSFRILLIREVIGAFLGILLINE